MQFRLGSVQIPGCQVDTGQFIVEAGIGGVAPSAFLQSIFGFPVLFHIAVGDTEIQIGIGCRLIGQHVGQDADGASKLVLFDRLLGILMLVFTFAVVTLINRIPGFGAVRLRNT